MNAHTIVSGLHHVLKEKPAVIWLRGKQYPSAVIAMMRTYIQEHIPVYMMSAETTPLEQIQMQCGSSFLGQTHVYILGDISKHLKQKQSVWQVFITSYKGPHTLVFWAPTLSPPASHFLTIDVLDTLDAQAAAELIVTFFPKQEKKSITVLRHVWKYTATLSYEQFLAIMVYAPIINEPYDQFVQTYIIPNLTPERSLFTLSQYFFGKKKGMFYKQWASIQSQYPLQFWLSFWSDQLWRATIFINYMHANKYPDAHEIAKSRLPFSFIKTDWKQFDPKTLQQYHAYLCSLDFDVKNGGNEVWIELFFMRWFLH